MKNQKIKKSFAFYHVIISFTCMFQTKFITDLFDIRLNLISRFIVEILNNNACKMYSMCLLHKKEIIYNFLQINYV